LLAGGLAIGDRKIIRRRGWRADRSGACGASSGGGSSGPRVRVPRTRRAATRSAQCF